MDIDELSKSQLILLTLFTSFVTSIATGIVTVTLLDEAPAPVVRTINRIVERTVETVVPASNDEGEVTTIQKTETVIVKEEDLIPNSIAAVERSMVRIYAVPEQNQTGGTGSPEELARTFKGIGIVLSPTGLVATADSALTPGRRYQVKTFGGAYYEAQIEVEGKEKYGLLRITASSTDLAALPPVKLADLSKVRLGHSAVALWGDDSTKVEIGVVGEITRGALEGKTDGPITSLKTSITARTTPGSPLISSFGEILGIGTGDTYVTLTEGRIAALTAATSTPSSQN